LSAAFHIATSSVGANSHSAPAAANTVPCRVLEAHTGQQLRLTLVVFHHRDEKERVRLGTLLRERSGASVEFQTADGRWYSGTVLRLKSCFGRGLLLFPTGTAQLAERDEILLKFPPN
jgi:hypothetical protein